MSESNGGESKLLVVTGDRAFGSAVVDAVEATEAAVSAMHVDSTADALAQSKNDDVDGAVVDGQIAEPTTAVSRLASEQGLPVLVLTTPTENGDTAAQVIEAGATDIFPRTTAKAQYELVVQRLTSESPDPIASAEFGVTERPYREIFENVSDGLVMHDPATGEMVDVNEQFCELNGYSRSELVGESIGLVTAPGDEYSEEKAVEKIELAREEGAQLFEWRNQRKSGETFPVEVHLTVVRVDGREQVLASVQDITERKRREREYEQIFNSVQDAITVHNPATGEMVNVNDTFCELVGYDRETILELGTTGVSVEEEGYTEEYAEEIITEVMRDGQTGPYEWMVETKAGDRRVTEVVATRGKIGGEDRVISINRDVTERKRREREYEQIFNMAGDGIVIHDPESGEIVDANQQIADLLGYDRQAFFDEPMSEFQATDEGVSGQLAREKVRESAETDGQEFEWPLETADGEKVWVRARHETGNIDGERRIVALLHDITERRRREQEYEQIFNGVQDAIVVHDPESGEMVDVNDAFCELVGYDREQVLELGTAGVSVENDGYTQDRAEEVIADAVEEGEVGPIEWKISTRDGNHRVTEVMATTADIGGEFRHLSILRDVTERQRREQRLEVFNRILRHNLRNQLDVIRSHGEVLADQTAGSHAERIIAAVDTLAGIGARARKTDQIMSMDDTAVEIDLSAHLREAVGEMKPKQSDVAVTTRLPEEAPLRTNKKVLTAAVESALENAFDYAESTTTVAIEDSPTGYVIRIEDDGPGIPEEDLLPIEAGTETNLQHGRGLGLWQLRWSVDKLNGELSFDTSGGTTVSIAIPDRRGSSQ